MRRNGEGRLSKRQAALTLSKIEYGMQEERPLPLEAAAFSAYNNFGRKALTRRTNFTAFSVVLMTRARTFARKRKVVTVRVRELLVRLIYERKQHSLFVPRAGSG